jgi:hypothetical protein
MKASAGRDLASNLLGRAHFSCLPVASHKANLSADLLPGIGKLPTTVKFTVLKSDLAEFSRAISRQRNGGLVE